jgi:chemosensory pili system protein ChpA (sensor histidine kinase/response regulator)
MNLAVPTSPFSPPPDAGPLAWVIDQVRDNLLAALTALRKEAQRTTAAPALGSLLQARHQIHQAAGAIDLLGHFAAARLVQAAERVIEHAIEQPSGLSSAAQAALESGLHAELDYLDALLSGKQEPALKLFKQYRELIDVSGGETAHPADLWEYDGDGSAAAPPTDAPPLRAADRNDYERALLEFLRQRDVVAATDAMGEVARRARAAAQGEQDGALWWLAEGFFEALGLGLLAPDVYAKRLCNRLNLQLKSLLAGQPQPAQRLAHELLFFCDQALARARAEARAAPALEAIGSRLGLGNAPLVDYQKAHFGLVDPALIQQIRKRIVQVRDGWAQVGNEDFSRTDRLIEATQQLGQLLRGLVPGAEVLPGAIEQVVRSIAAQRELLTPDRVLELATAVLFLEASFGHFRADDPDFLPRARELAQRLERSAVGAPAGTFAPWMEELYRKTSESQTMGSVVQELHQNMDTVERLLDGYFRDPATGPELAPVPALLGQMRGVLSVLGMDTGAQALGQIRLSVEGLMQSPPPEAEARAAGGTYDQLAGNIGALGFMVDMLAYQPDLAKSLFTFDAERGELRPIVASTPRTAPPSARPAPPAPAEPVAPQADVTDPDTAAGITPALVAPAEVAPPQPLSDDDRELLEIFLDEATDVIAAGKAVVSFLQVDADDDAALTSVRRAFHTLKGSSRMVGLNDFGEAAWEMEQLFNQVLAKQRRATLPVLDLAAKAFVEFDAWTRALREGDASAHSSASIAAAARGLRSGSGAPPATPWSAAEHTAALAADAGIAIEPAPQPEAAEAPSPFPSLELPDAALLDLLGPAPLPQAAEPEPAAPELAVPELAVPEPAEPELAAPELAAPELAAPEFVEPEPALQVEAEAAPSRADGGIATPPQTPDDGIKVIGDLRIPAPLYGIYLNEADELVRRLGADVAAWAALPAAAVAAETVALAHQLRGSSRTVGLTGVGRLAELMEQALQLQRGDPGAFAAADVALMQQSADQLRQMLHQFAAGFLRALPEESEAALQDLLHRLQRPRAAPPAIGVPAAAAAGTSDATLRDNIDPELFPIFEFEAIELMPQLAAALRQWEAAPHDDVAPKQAMRLLHTFKGSARMAGAMALGDQAHALESDIESLHGGGLPSEQALLDLVARHDALNTRFDRLREASSRGATELGELRVEHDLQAHPLEAHELDAFEVEELPLDVDARPQVPAPTPLRAGVASSRVAAQPVRVRAALLDRLVNQVGEVSIARARLDSEFNQIRSSTRDLGDNLERMRAQVRDIELQADAQMAARAQAAREDGRDFDPLEFDRFTRFQELTRMMAESVNDLALVQSTLSRTLQSTDENLARQGRLTRELQRDLLRTRMVEFDSIAERLYRTVRQAGKDAGKAVRLDILGGTTEIDRGVLDRMAGAFEHLLRNAVAHGLESAPQRAQAGKPATGSITLNLRQEGSEVVVAISDDGAGLDYAAISAKARALGLLQGDAQATEAQLREFIFRPGFSSMEQATEVAGRGVGLDVVRTDTRALGGRVELASTPGRGTTFTLVLPLTTAVTQIVLLRAGTRTYAVPSGLVDLVLRLKPAEVEQAAQQQQLERDGQTVPFYWLGALTADSGTSPQAHGRTIPVVLLRSASQRIALQVDDVLGNQEVVVKNLGPQLSRVPGLAGISVLPDGALVLIYNPVALAAVYGEQASQRMAHAAERSAALATAPHPDELEAVVAAPAAPAGNTVLVVDDSITVRRVTQRFLSRNGYNVLLAKDGLDALEQLQSTLPDIVLTDIEMPRMDGFDLTRNIRADERTRHLPVIMITSRIADKHRNYAHELGVNHYLGKPYSEDELLGLIRNYVVQPALH